MRCSRGGGGGRERRCCSGNGRGATAGERGERGGSAGGGDGGRGIAAGGGPISGAGSEGRGFRGCGCSGVGSGKRGSSRGASPSAFARMSSRSRRLHPNDDDEGDGSCGEGSSLVVGSPPSIAYRPHHNRRASGGKHVWVPPKSGPPWSEKLMAVSYLPSVKFKEPLPIGHGRSPYEISSISESRIKALYKEPSVRAAMAMHNSSMLTRIYPDGKRQDSSNMDPSSAWSMGCHMVCLNYQTWDLGMRLNFAKFLANGSCGYVLKRAFLRSGGGTAAAALGASSAATDGGANGAEGADGSGADESPAAVTAEEQKKGNRGKLARSFDFNETHLDAQYTLWHMQLASARHLPKTNEQVCIPEVYDGYCRPTGPSSSIVERVPSNKPASVTSPVVDVAVHGGGFRSVVATGQAYEFGSSYTTKAVAANGATPRFDEHIDCVVEQSDDAILAIHVYDRSVGRDTLIGYSCIPMANLRVGWRVVKLRSPSSGMRLMLGSLLVHFSRETRQGTPANMKKRGHGLMGGLMGSGSPQHLQGQRQVPKSHGSSKGGAAAGGATSAGGGNNLLTC